MPDNENHSIPYNFESTLLDLAGIQDFNQLSSLYREIDNNRPGYMEELRGGIQSLQSVEEAVLLTIKFGLVAYDDVKMLLTAAKKYCESNIPNELERIGFMHNSFERAFSTEIDFSDNVKNGMDNSTLVERQLTKKDDQVEFVLREPSRNDASIEKRIRALDAQVSLTEGLQVLFAEYPSQEYKFGDYLLAALKENARIITTITAFVEMEGGGMDTDFKTLMSVLRDRPGEIYSEIFQVGIDTTSLLYPTLTIVQFSAITQMAASKIAQHSVTNGKKFTGKPEASGKFFIPATLAAIVNEQFYRVFEKLITARFLSAGFNSNMPLDDALAHHFDSPEPHPVGGNYSVTYANTGQDRITNTKKIFGAYFTMLVREANKHLDQDTLNNMLLLDTTEN